MRSIARAFAAASIVLLGAAASLALEANLPPFVPPLQPAPELEPAMIELAGKASLRAGDERHAGRYAAGLAYDLDAKTFSLVPLLGFDVILYGHLAPKGKSGRKFTMFLDDASQASFTEFLSKLGEVMLTDTDPEAVLGNSTSLVMTLDESGAPALKIKSRVLTKGYGEVVFKGNAAQSEDPE